jgi:dTDP-4-amino-4,6-dideoxygalactose transaminase
VDVREDTFNMDPEDLKRKLGENTGAIMPVHLYGQSADMDAIMELAEEGGIPVIEDACQAHGALWNGKKAGSIGKIGAFSFYPTKNMTTGEGGMVTTDDPEIAENVRMLHNHGQAERYRHTELGWNFRMTNIAAAIGLEQLKKLDRNNGIRRRNAALYDELLSEDVIRPAVDERAYHVYHQYTIRVKNRDRVVEALKKEDIGFGIYYPIAIHQQEIMKRLGYTAELPVTERLVNEVLSIPVHPLVSEDDVRRVADVINRAI